MVGRSCPNKWMVPYPGVLWVVLPDLNLISTSILLFVRVTSFFIDFASKALELEESINIISKLLALT